MAEAHGLGVVLYSPLAGGLLTGKYRRGESGRLSARSVEGADAGRRERVLDAVLGVADEIGASPVGVSLAWVRGRAATAGTPMVPIVGPRTPSHLTEYLKALDIDLSPGHLQRLAVAGAIDLGSPHLDVIASLSHGVDGDRALLDLPRAAVV